MITDQICDYYLFIY